MKNAKDLVGKFYSGLTTVKDAIEALDSKYTVDSISIGEAYENLSFVNAPVKVTVVETPKHVEDVKKALEKANVDSVRMQGKNTVVFSVVTKGKMTESSGWVGEFVGLSVNKDTYIPCLGSDGVFYIDGRFSKFNAVQAATEKLAKYNKFLGFQKAVGFVLGKGEFRDVLSKDSDLVILDKDGRPTGKYIHDDVSDDLDQSKFRTIANELLSALGEEVAFFRDNGRHARYGQRYSLWIAKTDSVPQGYDTIKPTVKTLTAGTLNGLIDAVHSYVEGK